MVSLGIKVCEHMVGCKRAIRMGDMIYLSPAMYDLICHAEGDELVRLLAVIPLLEIPDYRTCSFEPMLTVDLEDTFQRDQVLMHRLGA